MEHKTKTRLSVGWVFSDF